MVKTILYKRTIALVTSIDFGTAINFCLVYFAQKCSRPRWRIKKSNTTQRTVHTYAARCALSRCAGKNASCVVTSAAQHSAAYVWTRTTLNSVELQRPSLNDYFANAINHPVCSSPDRCLGPFSRFCSADDRDQQTDRLTTLLRL